MFVIAMEEKLVLCRPFVQIPSWLPCRGAVQRQCAACRSGGWFCVCMFHSYCHCYKRFTELSLYLLINSEC